MASWRSTGRVMAATRRRGGSCVAVKTRSLPVVGTYLTDGERLVMVVTVFKENPGVRVEDAKSPSEEFVIPVGKMARWRTVKADA